MSKTIDEEYIELAADYGVDVKEPKEFYQSQKALLVEIIKHVHRLDQVVYAQRHARNERSTDCDMTLVDVPGEINKMLDSLDEPVRGVHNMINNVHNFGNCVDCDKHECAQCGVLMPYDTHAIICEECASS